MTATTDALPPPAAAGAPLHRTRPFLWSVRRELWENRAIFWAPLIAAGVVLFGAILSHTAPHHVVVHANGRPVGALPPILTYAGAAGVIAATSAIVAIFYCLGALNHERRDRSVLFWKSLPVSDVTTVLSKAVVPALIMPVVTLAVIFVTHLLMLAMDLAHLSARGGDASGFLANLPLGQAWLDLAYAYLLLVFWWAPVWSWLLLASAWAKRVPFLWAFGPPLGICVVEGMALPGSHHFADVLKDRSLEGIGIGFTTPPRGSAVQLPWPDPLPFLASPGLWIGLLAAAAFLFAAIWLRRRREPI